MILRPLLRAGRWPALVLGTYLVARAVVHRAVSWGLANVAFHIAGGVTIAHLADVAMAPVLAELRGRTRALARVAGIVALTATVAVSWEFLECLSARIHGVQGPSAGGDTLRDIAAGMAGAVAYLAATSLVRARRAQAQAT